MHARFYGWVSAFRAKYLSHIVIVNLYVNFVFRTIYSLSSVDYYRECHATQTRWLTIRKIHFRLTPPVLRIRCLSDFMHGHAKNHLSRKSAISFWGSCAQIHVVFANWTQTVFSSSREASSAHALHTLNVICCVSLFEFERIGSDMLFFGWKSWVNDWYGIGVGLRSSVAIRVGNILYFPFSRTSTSNRIEFNQ